ncbi:MAG: threonine dehydratase [Acidimicrobiales bacterium]|nr:threonine dehydratase [Acidimicrobiales bacterium]
MRIELEQLRAAQDVVYRHFRATPQYAWPLLREALGVEVVVKHENCTPTGAFKVRGGLVYVDRLTRERPGVGGVASATTGNHGQSLAYAGRAFGVRVTIVVPEGNSVEKNAAMRGFGAELIVHGEDFQSAREHSAVLARERGYELVPPYHPDLVLGVATYAHELFSAAGHLDAVLVPIGMGSGINAVIGVRDLMGLDTEVIGVTAVGAPATARSFAARKVIATPSIDTFIDGVATRQPDPSALDGILGGASRIVEITDADAGAAMRLAYRCTHHLPCPAGALGLAALMGERDRWRGRRVGVVFTSSNLDTALAARVLAG